MISFAEARATVLRLARPLGTEQVELSRLLGRYLAEPVIAPIDVPRFTNAAVDGFGVRAAEVAFASPEVPAVLQIQGAIHAGDVAEQELPAGCTVKLLTGAPIPQGVEAVVMAEHSVQFDGHTLITRSARPGENIRNRGEELCRGQQVLPAGQRATPAVVGLLATLGYASFQAYALPRVALVITGSELAQPGEALEAAQIYDANSPAAVGALMAMGLRDWSLVRARDDLLSIKEAIARALEERDVVIAAGGVSVGDRDFVRDACAALSVTTHFWGVAMKPAKPTYLGTWEESKLVFGLPGNPAAALVAFHQLVKPALLQMMGARDTSPLLLAATVKADLRKKRGRIEFVRALATAEEGRLTVAPVAGQGSHMLGGMAEANCLMHLPPETETVARGEQVAVEFICWDR